ncbi:MAG: helix-turn-helix domain-containing protein [Actinomycetota bacterium]
MSLSAKMIREARTAAGLTQAELARRAGTSQPTVAAYESGGKTPTVGTLERLLRVAGAVLVSQPDSRRHAGRLRRLLRERRQTILDIAAKHRARNVRVVGSVARNEEGPGSDLDLLVDMDPGGTLLDQVRLRRELAESLGVRVDVITSGGLLARDRQGMLRDAVPV